MLIQPSAPVVPLAIGRESVHLPAKEEAGDKHGEENKVSNTITL